MNNLTPSQADRTALTGNTLLQFIFDDNTIRAGVDDNGEPYFVAADIARELDLGNSRQALSRLADDEKADVVLNDGSQRRRMAVVNLPGLLALIGSSRKESTKPFRRWMFHEVIPAVIKRGGYILPTATDEQVNRLLAQHEADQQEKAERDQYIDRLETRNGDQQRALDGAEAARRKGWYGGHAGLSHPDGEDER